MNRNDSYANLIVALDDKCHRFREICHYKRNFPFVNIETMFRDDYAQLSIFAGLDGDQISQLSPYMVECQFPKNSLIFRQGQPAEHLYILLAGEVVINYKPYDGPPLTVTRILPGGVFGWSSALGRDIYTSDAVAITDSCAVRLRGHHLQTLCEKHPDTGMILLDRLASVIAERLQTTHTQILGILTQGMDVDGNCLRRMSRDGRKQS